jgi:hypothetical protein
MRIFQQMIMRRIRLFSAHMCNGRQRQLDLTSLCSGGQANSKCCTLISALPSVILNWLSDRSLWTLFSARNMLLNAALSVQTRVGCPYMACGCPYMRLHRRLHRYSDATLLSTLLEKKTPVLCSSIGCPLFILHVLLCYPHLHGAWKRGTGRRLAPSSCVIARYVGQHTVCVQMACMFTNRSSLNYAYSFTDILRTGPEPLRGSLTLSFVDLHANCLSVGLCIETGHRAVSQPCLVIIRISTSWAL